MASMTRVPWGTLESVGDQSEYVNAINLILTTSFPTLGSLLSPVYFQFFLDKGHFLLHVKICVAPLRVDNMSLQKSQFAFYEILQKNIKKEPTSPQTVSSDKETILSSDPEKPNKGKLKRITSQQIEDTISEDGPIFKRRSMKKKIKKP